MYGEVYHHLDFGDRNGTILKHICEGFMHVNYITIMDEFDTFDQLVLTIGVRLIEIVPDVGT